MHSSHIRQSHGPYPRGRFLWYSGDDMPYKIVKRTGARPWKVINLDRNEVVGSSVTKKMAEASARARLAGEHGGLVRRKR